MTGDYVVNQWQGKKETVDFYLAKGVIERVAQKLNLNFEYRATEINGLHPGRTAMVSLKGKHIGYIGEMHPTVAADNYLKPHMLFH